MVQQGESVKISVIMPCHNCAPWVQQSLLSVASQLLRPHEVIVIDDSSTDDSVEKILNCGFEVTLLQSHHGNAAAARNEGISAATGDWIAFLDADDIWLDCHLSRFASTINQGSQAYFAHRRSLDTDGRVSEVPRPFDVKLPTFYEEEAELLEWYLKSKGGWPTSGVIALRKGLLEAGCFCERLRCRHDTEMFVRVTLSGGWTYNPEPTWLYRAGRPGNISGNLVEGLFYEYLSRLRVRSLFNDPRIESHVRQAARSALGKARQLGSEADVKRIIQASGDDLPGYLRLLYRLVPLSLLKRAGRLISNYER